MAFDGRAPGAPSPAPEPTSRPAPTAAPPPPPAQPAKIARNEKATSERTVAKPRAAAPVDDKPADPQLAWARAQHQKINGLIAGGDCRSAAQVAIALEARAPEYFAQNVATSRELKSCTSYIAQEREKVARERAAERARAAKKAGNEPAATKAAPAKPTASEKTDATK